MKHWKKKWLFPYLPLLSCIYFCCCTLFKAFLRKHSAKKITWVKLNMMDKNEDIEGIIGCSQKLVYPWIIVEVCYNFIHVNLWIPLSQNSQSVGSSDRVWKTQLSRLTGKKKMPIMCTLKLWIEWQKLIVWEHTVK